jgi:hypothetical protein
MNGETTTSSWFKVTREVFSLGILQSSEWDKITVWLFLLSSAAHHPHEAQVHGRCFALERGQCALSVNDLADKAGWKRMRLRYFLRQLVKEGMISMAGGKSGTVLSIANYDKWQLNQPISQPISQVKQAPVLAMSSLCSQVSSQPISQASEEVSSHTLFQEGSAVEGSLEEKEGGQRIQPAIASRPPAFVKLSNEQDVQEVMKLWNTICVPSGLPRVNHLTGKRPIQVRMALHEYSLEELEGVIRRVTESDFLCGRAPSPTHPHFRATFDWVFDKRNLPKVADGNYDKPRRLEDPTPSPSTLPAYREPTPEEVVASKELIRQARFNLARPMPCATVSDFDRAEDHVHPNLLLPERDMLPVASHAYEGVRGL